MYECMLCSSAEINIKSCQTAVSAIKPGVQEKVRQVFTKYQVLPGPDTAGLPASESLALQNKNLFVYKQHSADPISSLFKI